MGCVIRFCSRLMKRMATKFVPASAWTNSSRRAWQTWYKAFPIRRISVLIYAVRPTESLVTGDGIIRILRRDGRWPIRLGTRKAYWAVFLVGPGKAPFGWERESITITSAKGL